MLDEDEALANNNNSLCSICGGDNEAAFIFLPSRLLKQMAEPECCKKKSICLDRHKVSTSIDIEQSKKLRTRGSGMYPWVMSQGPGYFTAVGIPVL